MTVETSAFVKLHEARLDADASRMVTRLILPREDEAGGVHRAQQLADRLDAIPTHEATDVVREAIERYSSAHVDFASAVLHNARIAGSLLHDHINLDASHEMLMGMAFTAEFATEAAAICNPSAVLHPNQKGLKAGEIRVAVSLRAIGEGHISSLCFAEAIVSKDSWNFLPRDYPPAVADIVEGEDAIGFSASTRPRFDRQLAMASTNVGQAPSYASPSANSFVGENTSGPADTVYDRRQGETVTASSFGRRAGDTVLLYKASFDPSSTLSQRILLPEVFDEAHGLEDARFVHVTDANGASEYRATYVAFDGSSAVPRLMVSPDLVTFESYKMTGPGTADKGLALFPRQVNGENLALTRSGWQDISLARSVDGLHWFATDVLYTPSAIWEILKSGNCGSPLEIEQGWLVVTHGVGPVRGYSIGAILLDKNDPSIVIGHTAQPFIFTAGTNVAGYVPNVVYSCGGLVHEGTLWLPFAEGDNCVRVASIVVGELLAAMDDD